MKSTYRQDVLNMTELDMKGLVMNKENRQAWVMVTDIFWTSYNESKRMGKTDDEAVMAAQALIAVSFSLGK